MFEEFDTYADVYLNEKPILKADNMFRTWRVNCADVLTKGNNTLRISFRSSPINEILPLMAKMNYQLPAGNDRGQNFTSHSQGSVPVWPRIGGRDFVTSGIWRPVFLEAWDSARISNLHIEQNQVTKEQASLTAQVDMISSVATQAELIIEDVGHKTVAAKQSMDCLPEQVTST